MMVEIPRNHTFSFKLRIVKSNLSNIKLGVIDSEARKL